MMGLARRSSLLVAVVLASLAGCATTPPATRIEAEPEIEPIPLDSNDPRYSNYLVQVRRRIKEQWRYPCATDPVTKRCEYRSARLVLMFDILKDGRAARLVIMRSSGYEIYDQYALNAIGRASPFPPLPPELIALATPGSMRIRIIAAFAYELKEGTAPSTGSR
jgi:TonB family protein